MIEKGKEWGSGADGATAFCVVADDRELAAAAYSLSSVGVPLDVASSRLLSVRTGDVLRELGLAKQREPQQQRIYPFDLGLVSLDDAEPLPFVAHMIVRNRLWSGPFAAVMNVGWFGQMYLGPRAHPNDGLLDITCGALSLQQRSLARAKVKMGTHLPHPDLAVKRSSEWESTFMKPTTVYLDGSPVGRYQQIRVQVLSDFFAVLA